MPRYFFHFSDGKRQFTDDTGVELSGMAAARSHANRHIRDLKAAMCAPIVQDLTGWSMTVVDAADKTVLEMSFERETPKAEA